jgi:serine/threonine-protein kinase RsbW
MSEKKEVITEIKIPAKPELLSTVRLTISGLASQMNFSEESIEDIKVAVSEACTNVVQYAYPKKNSNNLIFITIKQRPKNLEITIKDNGKGFDHKNPPTRAIHDKDIHLGLGIVFMKNLMDKVEIDSKPNKGTIVTLIKKIK